MIGLYARQIPPQELTRYVKAFYVADVPDLTMDIVSPPTGYPLLGLIWRGFNGAELEGEPQQFGTGRMRHFSGQLYRKRALVRWKGGIGHAIAEFTATGLFELFGVPGEQLINTTRSVYDLHPTFDRDLAAKTSGCIDAQDYVAALQIALTSQVAHAQQAPAILLNAIKMMEKAHGAIRISDVTAAYHAKERTFSTAFKSVVGLTPKYFCRIMQFNYVGQLILSGGGDDLADLATEAGFFDQAHFTRAFQEFAAQSPQAFMKSDEVNLSTFIRLIDKS
ncbi:MAG: helix-turn-helix domain-containing protein [Xanthomonadales bacterium]|nr:helix-turn-helix domain-containing protein [Xanthomonadales bacterium]